MGVLNTLDKLTFAELFDRLCAGLQHEVGKSQREATLAVYYDAVQRFGRELVTTAIERMLADPPRYFPKSGELARACYALHRGDHQEELKDLTTCPSCRTEFRWCTWLIRRRFPKSRRNRDERTTVVEMTFEGNPTPVEFVSGERMYCECGFALAMAARETEELLATEAWYRDQPAHNREAAKALLPVVQRELSVRAARRRLQAVPA